MSLTPMTKTYKTPDVDVSLSNTLMSVSNRYRLTARDYIQTAPPSLTPTDAEAE